MPKLVGFAAVAAVATIVISGAIAAARTIGDDKVTGPHDCARDGELTINANHDTIDLTGTCARVVINGNFATVRGSAQRIAVNGNDNVITADTLGELSLQGNRNTVTWKAGVKGDPKIANLGTNNSVSRAK
jgi:hypothetical protein